MGERLITIPLSERTRGLVKELGISLEDWHKQALFLGLLVENKMLYQRVGPNFMLLKMRDIDPLPGSHIPGNTTTNLEIRLTDEQWADIVKQAESLKYLDFEVWYRRALMLRLRAEGLNLHTCEEGVYVKVDLSSMEIPEVPNEDTSEA